MPYTPLHLHTDVGSLLDSAIRIKDLVPYLKEQGITSCAISDHGSMAGVVEFQKEMIKAGIKPILGCEIYCTDDPDDLEDNTQKHKDNYHLVVLAKDNTGLKSLFSLLSNAAAHNFYYKPRIWKKHLVELAGHVIVTSACLGSEIAKKDFANRDNLYTTVRELTYIFGKDFYLELQDWDDGTGIQPAYNKYLRECATHALLPAQYILTTDAHYLRKEDYKLHEIMMAMQLKKTLREYREEGKMVYGPYFYVKTDEEMKRSSMELEIPEAYENTIKIAEQCSASIELGKYHMPSFKIEETEDYQEFLSWRAAKQHTGETNE